MHQLLLEFLKISIHAFGTEISFGVFLVQTFKVAGISCTWGPVSTASLSYMLMAEPCQRGVFLLCLHAFRMYINVYVFLDKMVVVKISVLEVGQVAYMF